MQSKSKEIIKRVFWQVVSLSGLVIILATPVTHSLQKISDNLGFELPSILDVARAEEIYPLFTCPCCGEPLDKEEPCCDSMTEMIEFIDHQIKLGSSRKTVMLKTTYEFGLDRLTREEDRIKLKAQLIANAPENAPRIKLEQVKLDLGKVSQTSGIVTGEFVIENEGESDLVINKLVSSCGCTSGSVIYKDKEGPRFYMPGHGHDKPDESWEVAIAPGDKAIVKAYYDPTVHPDLVGPVTRTLSILSNDPVNQETKLTIILEQI